MREPRPHPFLGAEFRRRPRARGAASVLGLPFDGGVSFRPGAADGPSGVRTFSGSIETFSPRAERDLGDLDLTDLGDLDGSPDDIEEAVAGAAGAGPVALIGGDHSVTPRAVAGVARHHEGLAVVGFDAHLDLREEYAGDHACTYRRIADRGVPCHVLGPRSGTRDEWQEAPTVLASVSRDLDVGPVVTELTGRPVYITVDIDVLDPSAAPGTGNPEPGGPTFDQLLAAVEGLSGLDVVAFDVVEVSPPLDPSGITQAAGAVLVREMLLRFA